MQLERAKFADNGGCGYVLKPPYLRSRQPTAAPAAPDTDADDTIELAVACGPGGLGLGLDEDNRVTRLVPGGEAEREGLLRVGDLVIAVDGERLGRRMLAEVMPKGHAQYAFTVERAPAAAAAAAAPPPPPPGPLPGPPSPLPGPSDGWSVPEQLRVLRIEILGALHVPCPGEARGNADAFHFAWWPTALQPAAAVCDPFISIEAFGGAFAGAAARHEDAQHRQAWCSTAEVRNGPNPPYYLLSTAYCLLLATYYLLLTTY